MEAWINGVRSAHFDVSDRGLHYGDGLFETMPVREGRVSLLTRHLERLVEGCVRLALPHPDRAQLTQEIRTAAAARKRCVLKLIVTRGSGGRGYGVPQRPAIRRVLLRYAWPHYPLSYAGRGISARICSMRLGSNPRLAGIKHLNRLENVLARAEWPSDAEYQEGLMLNDAGHVIEGTKTNLFAGKDGVLVTPALDRTGVAGILRGVILEAAAADGVATRIANITLPELVGMDELFVCNSLIGVWPLIRLGADIFPVGELTRCAARWVDETVCAD